MKPHGRVHPLAECQRSESGATRCWAYLGKNLIGLSAQWYKRDFLEIDHIRRVCTYSQTFYCII